VDSCVLPGFVLEHLEKLAARAKIPIDELRKELEEILDDDFIKHDPIFESDDERLSYAINTLCARNVRASPVEETDAVPIILRARANIKKLIDLRARANEERSAFLYEWLDLLQEMEGVWQAMDPAHREVSP